MQTEEDGRDVVRGCGAGHGPGSRVLSDLKCIEDLDEGLRGWRYSAQYGM